MSAALEVFIENLKRLWSERRPSLAFLRRHEADEVTQVLRAVLVSLLGHRHPPLQHWLDLLSTLRRYVQLLKPDTTILAILLYLNYVMSDIRSALFRQRTAKSVFKYTKTMYQTTKIIKRTKESFTSTFLQSMKTGCSVETLQNVGPHKNAENIIMTIIIIIIIDNNNNNNNNMKKSLGYLKCVNSHRIVLSRSNSSCDCDILETGGFSDSLSYCTCHIYVYIAYCLYIVENKIFFFWFFS